MGKTKPFWHSSEYVSWFTADTASAVGLALRALAISLIGYSISGSTAAAGWLGTLSMIAQQVAGMFGGTFVDRHDRKLLIIVNSVAGALAWGTVGVLLICNALSFPMLLAIAVLASGINGFLGSATDAMLRSIVDIRDYPKARSLNEGRDATVNMAGSPVGGFLYSVRPWLPFLISAAMYALAGTAATGIRDSAAVDGHDDGVHIGKPRSSFLHDFAEGWLWSLRRKLLVVILVVAALVNFGINGIQYAIQLHMVANGTNATSIGFISGGISLAMLVGSFLAGKLSDKVPVGPTVCLAYVFMCVCAVPMTLTDNYWTVLIANSLIGLPFPIINAMLLGFIFAKSPITMQGRITVTLTVPAQVLSSFCSGAAGTLLPILGFRGTVLSFLIVVAVSSGIAICCRPIRRIPRSAEWGSADL